MPGTECDTAMGTPGYLPPEQSVEVIHFSNIITYKAADMWACGVVLFCLLTGRFPWYAPMCRFDTLKVEYG